MAVFSITAKVVGWKAIIAALRNASEEASFKITNEGIRFYGTTPGNWFIISLLWERKNLNELTLDVERTIGFRTDDFDKILKRFGDDDTITIAQKQENDGYISITAKDRSWDLRTIHSEMINELKEPKVDYTVSFAIPPTQLKDALADVAIFSENVKFVSDNGTVHLESSNESGKAKTVLTGIVTDQTITSKYSLEYIAVIMSAVCAVSQSIKVSYSHQKPLLLEFDIINTGTLRYHLAPIMETQND